MASTGGSGYRYHLSDQQLAVFRSRTASQRLGWLDEMRFLSWHMAPAKSRRWWQRLRQASEGGTGNMTGGADPLRAPGASCTDAREAAKLEVRRELVWDYAIPPHPEADDGFLALYVGRVLDRGCAADVRSLGLPLIRRYLDVAPARREVIRFWRRWLSRLEASEDGDHQPGTEALPGDRGIGRSGRL